MSPELTKVRAALEQMRAALDANGLRDWTPRLILSRRRLGQCSWRTKEIRLSRDHVTHSSEADVTDTIMHEVAHAVVGPGHGHDHVWKAAAVRLGATPRACASELNMPSLYVAKCECGLTFKKHQLRRASLFLCGRCRRPLAWARTE